MNIPAAVLAITTLGLGAASVYLYTELDAERERATAEAALRRDQEQRAAALEAARQDLERQLQVLLAGGPPSPNLFASEAEAFAPGPPPGLTADGPMPGEGEPALRRRFDEARGFWRRMLNDPNQRAAFVAQQKMALRTTYKDLAAELKLSADDVDRLMDLMAEQAVERMTRLQGADDPAEASRIAAEMQREHELALMSALGGKYQQFEQYQKTIGERMQVDQIGTQLAAANLPLQDSQKKQMIAAMAEERQAGPPAPTWTEGQSPREYMQATRAWQQEYNQRVLSRLSGVLSPQQLRQYEEIQRAQMGFPGFGGFGFVSGGPMGMSANGAVVNAMPGPGGRRGFRQRRQQQQEQQ